jgi:hypothetical protein
MSIIIQTKHCQLSPRFRHLIESYIRRAMRREQRQISSVTLTISPTTLAGEPGFRCKVRVWSHFLGDIVVDDVGNTVWSTTQRVTASARHAFRRKLHKRLSKYRRIKRDAIVQWLPDAVSRRLKRVDFGTDITRTLRLPNTEGPRLDTFQSNRRFVARPSDRLNGSHDQGEPN